MPYDSMRLHTGVDTDNSCSVSVLALNFVEVTAACHAAWVDLQAAKGPYLIDVPPRTIAAKMHQPQPSFSSFASNTAPTAKMAGKMNRNTMMNIVSMILPLVKTTHAQSYSNPPQAQI